MAAKSDYYDILGVTKEASDEELKKAYRKQALEWHPDKHTDNKEAAEKRFKEINEAYQILSDKEKRSAYDRFGHSAFSPGGGFGGAGRAQQQGPFTYTYTSSGNSPFSGYDFGDPFDIFEQFFGGGSRFRTASIPRHSVSIEFMEAIEGVSKEIDINGRKRKVKIPAGIDEGSSIRFDDFILTVNVKPHATFERDGVDVFAKLQIPFSMAVLGGKVDVPTVMGDVKLKIRPGTQSGTMVRLRDKGAPRLRGRGNGDHYVRLEVAVPSSPTRAQKRLAEKLKKDDL